MQTEVEEQVEVMDQWPPLAHLIRKEDEPVKKGTIALCGTKLMGITLPDGAATCKKCIEIAKAEMGL